MTCVIDGTWSTIWYGNVNVKKTGGCFSFSRYRLDPPHTQLDFVGLILRYNLHVRNCSYDTAISENVSLYTTTLVTIIFRNI